MLSGQVWYEGTGRAAHGQLDLLTLVANSALGWNTSLNTQEVQTHS